MASTTFKRLQGTLFVDHDDDISVDINNMGTELTAYGCDECPPQVIDLSELGEGDYSITIKNNKNMELSKGVEVKKTIRETVENIDVASVRVGNLVMLADRVLCALNRTGHFRENSSTDAESIDNRTISEYNADISKSIHRDVEKIEEMLFEALAIIGE